MKYIILGSAGHVDHGKSALIKALTGTDTDRLQEEKARGISIDLGFAVLRFNGELTAGIVDVPGHERFLKNMLAGAGGIDMAMMVIAADEGVMPQTLEHLAMLELLDVQKGIVVLTKIDKVEADWLGLVEEEVNESLAGTFLANAPICRVSSLTGEGLDTLRQVLFEEGMKIRARDSAAPFRLWVDRVFSVKGYGTVVTGSALSGCIGVGGELALNPGGELLRVRGLEWHGSKVEQIVAGQRAAINLGGIDATDISRGMVLSSASRGVTSDSWDAMARWNQAVPSGMRVRVHIGTGEFLGRVYSLKDQPSHYMRLVLEKPLTAAMNDKCIIRQYSPQHLLGGMTLIAPNKQSRRMSATRVALAEAMAARRLADIVYCLIADHAEPETVDEIKRDSGYTQDRMVEDVLAKLLSERKIVSIGSYYLTAQGLEALTQKMVELVGRYHKEQANRAGLSKDILRQKLKLPERPFEVLLDYWQTHKVIALQGAEVALAGFVGNHTQWRQNMVETVESLVEDLGLTSIDSQLLLQKMKISAGEARTVIELLLREGLLVRVGELQLHQKTLANIAMMIKQHFAAHPSLTVAEFRDMLNTSRKVALPLLEFYDMKRYTLRCGEARGPGPKLQDLK